jgi:glycerate kinase
LDGKWIKVPVLDPLRRSLVAKYLLLKTIRFDELTHDADLVITGEGAADRQTLMGKLPTGILRHSHGVPVCLMAGRVADKEALLHAGFTHVECINQPDITLEEAMRPDVAKRNIQQTAVRMLED